MNYTEYRQIDELWLMTIPKHWEDRKIKYVFSERVEKGYPDEQLLVASQNMGVVPKGVYGSRTVEATKDLHNLKLVRIGDFVISLRSFQGGLEYAYYQGIISPAYTVMIPNELIIGGYFRFLAKSKLFIELLQMCVTGIREGQNIDYSKLKNHLIPLPSISEQNQIVAFLDWKVSGINKLINAKKKQIALLQEQKRAVVNEAVTRGGDNWSVAKLKHLCLNIGDIDHKMPEAQDDGIPYVSPKDFYSENAIDFDNAKKISRRSFEELSKKIKPERGDLIFSRYATLGATRIVETDIDFLVSYSCVTIKPNNKKICSRFLYYYFASSLIEEEKRNFAFETTQSNIGIDSIKRFQVPYPIDVSAQQAIVAHLDKQCGNIEKIIEKINTEITLLGEYRSRLISDVVTGKKDVRGVDVPQYEAVEVAGEYEEVEGEE
jgi:type I restriction enzyme S subunit